MRIINADELKTAFPPGEYVRTECVRATIDHMPAINAIPIEWLQHRRDIYLKAYHAGHESEIHTAAILNDTLMAWLKEHGEKENEENTDN